MIKENAGEPGENLKTFETHAYQGESKNFELPNFEERKPVPLSFLYIDPTPKLLEAYIHYCFEKIDFNILV